MLLSLRIAQGHRLLDSQTLTEGVFFYRTLVELLSSAGGPIRLRIDRDDAMLRMRQGSQRRHGKLGRARKDNG
jgi:hypothetical protein